MSSRLTRCSAACLVVVLLALPARAAEVKVERVEVQTQGDDTYFYVRLACPDDFVALDFETSFFSRGANLSRRPQLIPQDDKTTAVYPAVRSPGWQSQQFEFAGKLCERGEARFLVTYLRDRREPRTDGDLDRARLPLTVDFAKAVVPRLLRVVEANPTDDLKRVWGEAQAMRFADLEEMTDTAGFYTFAREATNRRYSVGVKATRTRPFWWGRVGGSGLLYDDITGATAIAETLQTERKLRADAADKGPRRIDVTTVRGIDVAEHPWEKMLAGKRPAVEPLAVIAPHDNYWLHFKDLRTLMEAKELLTEWGGTGLQTLSPTRRDAQVLARYEKQLCLRVSPEAVESARRLVKGVAFTGSDLAFAEGTDVTLLFHVTDVKAYYAAVEPGLAAARKEFGDTLKTARDEYRGVTVESFVTPLREVSLQRAAFGEYVVWSNSAVAVRRVLDVAKGKAKSLAESLDYQYMRTVYKADDTGEDGFAFMSDAFIRRLVGPATKIQEKRRLEAITSLRLATNGALFTAWETGSLPVNQKALLAASGLKARELEVPEGKAVTWDAGRSLAVSEVYGTIHFATPLVELPLDKVTEGEAHRYERFRQDYSQLWRQYFDPIGLRLAVSEKRVRWDVFILPLVENSFYNLLRRLAGGGTVRIDPADRPPNTLLDFVGYIDRGVLSVITDSTGTRTFVRVKANPLVRKLLTRELHDSLTGSTDVPFFRLLRAAQEDKEFGVAAGHSLKEIKEPKDRIQVNVLTQELTRARDDYRGTPCYESEVVGGPLHGLPVRHARVGENWVMSLGEGFLRDHIDHHIDQKQVQPPEGEEAADANLSLYLAMGCLDKQELGRAAAEWCEIRGPENASFWSVLTSCGLLPRETSSEEQRRATALHYFGFVPVGPDAADPSTSPAKRLLEGIRWLRADLRFRDDGVQTTVIIERQPSRK